MVGAFLDYAVSMTAQGQKDGEKKRDDNLMTLSLSLDCAVSMTAQGQKNGEKKRDDNLMTLSLSLNGTEYLQFI